MGINQSGITSSSGEAISPLGWEIKSLCLRIAEDMFVPRNQEKCHKAVVYQVDLICIDMRISNVWPLLWVIDPVGKGKTEGAWRLTDQPSFLKVSRVLRFRQGRTIISRHGFKTNICLKGLCGTGSWLLVYSPIHTALSRRESCAKNLPRHLCESYRGREKAEFHSASDLPPEVVSEQQQRRDGRNGPQCHDVYHHASLGSTTWACCTKWHTGAALPRRCLVQCEQTNLSYSIRTAERGARDYA